MKEEKRNEKKPNKNLNFADRSHPINPELASLGGALWLQEVRKCDGNFLPCTTPSTSPRTK